MAKRLIQPVVATLAESDEIQLPVIGRVAVDVVNGQDD